MGCSSTARAKGRNLFVKKSCLPLTIDLIFLLEIKLIRGETEKKKKKTSFYIWLVHMLHKFENRNKKIVQLQAIVIS